MDAKVGADCFHLIFSNVRYGEFAMKPSNSNQIGAKTPRQDVGTLH
ncbi:hypothetical protein COLO4_33806 [Corchorus olitorius]|uniref:Uncharacterized protein n=1 Tax=Corchorus olitorius TaxID=93759 RepID=A0A1R3GRF4_9ROSI|nr:hypothetical protein COLO4_33806 [Corchorus olitorius]